MSDKPFIPWSCVGPRLPIIGTAVWLLVLDRFNAPSWLFAVFITLAVIVWLVMIYALYHAEASKPFEVWFKALNDKKAER